MKDDPKTKKQLIDELTELRLQNAALKESKSADKYRSLVENIKDVIYELDSQGVILYISPAVRDMLGFDSSEIIGKNLTELAHEEDLSRLEEWFSELRKGRESPSEYRVKDKSGQLRWAQTRVRPIMEDSQFRGARGILIDVTEQKHAEERLRKSEEKYRSVFENSIMGISQMLRDGRLIAVNNAYAKMYGYANAEEMMTEVSNAWQLCANTEEREDVLRILTEKGVMEPREINVIRRDGTRFTVLAGTREIRDSKGTPLYYQAEQIDITKRKQAEEALQESEEKYRWVLNNMVDVITVTDMNLHFTYVSPSIIRFRGYTAEEAVAQTFEQVMTPESLQISARVFEEEMKLEASGTADPDRIRIVEVEQYRKDGSIVWMENHLSFMRDEAKEAVGIISVSHDITQRKLAEEKLQQTLKNLRNAVNTTIQVIISTVEVRDPYTANHQARVANLARAIATDMELSPDRIEGIWIAGSIHDVGKLSIPTEILSKPGKITENEFALIKEHPTKGYEILKNVESPWPLAEIVYQHHERMDGSGYPRNLKGDAILMEARILAVSDVIEAMASRRPYRAALGIDAALKEIGDNRGILYDADVVDVCLRLFNEKEYQLESA